jgi:hypothetical protein
MSGALQSTATRPRNADVITLRQAADLDRQADMLLSVGRWTQAEMLAHIAADLRQAVAR